MKSRWRIKHRIEDQHFIEVCNQAQSMTEAASILGLHFNSFKKRAIELECYQPNQAGISIRKNKPKIPIEDIIEKDLHPQYQSFKLKKRLLAEGIFKNECYNCGLQEWQGKSLEMELHHQDGNRNNHLLSNLSLLCPNCHSQTENYRSKNRK